MIIKSNSTRKRLACFFLALLIVQGITPTVAWALTSGPAQPETKQFAQAGTSDMVDLSTGNFKYNIPLLDVDGYPVNLNYQSGAGMDDEASWVGLGWNLNVGAINRQLRGIADDSNGDTLTTENKMKAKITGGGTGTVRGELFGSGITGSVSVSIFNDNYTGIGAEVGVNAGLSLSKSNGSYLSPGLNVGLSSSTADGVSVTPSISLSGKKSQEDVVTSSVGLSVGVAYNSREGLKSLTFGLDARKDELSGSGSVFLRYNTPPFYPRSSTSFQSSNSTYSGDLGLGIYGVYVGIGGTGYKTKREVKDTIKANRTYGFMYAEKGKKEPDAMMDFMREKENPIIPELKNLAVPVSTPDIFSYTSQTGSGQLRLFRNGTGVFFDNETNDISDNKSASVELGMGGIAHTGVKTFNQDINSVNGKWKVENNFLKNGDFPDTANYKEEYAYFKEVGEKNVTDTTFNNLVNGEQPVSIPLDKKTAKPELKSLTAVSCPPAFRKSGRQVKRSPVMMLTAREASQAALDKTIKNYPFNRYQNFQPVACNKVTGIAEIPRVDNVKKPSHISEMTITGDDGKRMVYGLPVYNLKQDEYSFATKASPDQNSNLVDFTLNPDGTINHKPLTNNKSLTDEYYHKETQPAYATSYLLTGILSPDYVDVTNNGISEDDRGTAIKFNYSKNTTANYKWRTPYGIKKATFNRGLNADPDDNKASFVYGEKELWYLHSIESKTKIVYFITDDREDGLGYDWLGNRLEGTADAKQKVLKEIRIYSKNDLSKPIKTVVLNYDYNGGSAVPNSKNSDGGKLQLKSVHFTYASSSKGKYNPYTFEYDKGPAYAYRATDRWGTYKQKIDNGVFDNLYNDEYPYATQDTAAANKNAGKWQLNKITLPTGGEINIKYESDDYAYVQNRHAMQMVKFKDMLDGNDHSTSSLREAKKFVVSIGAELPGTGVDATSWFISKYLNGESFMYARFFVNVSDEPASASEDKFDFVPGYGKVDKVELKKNNNENVAVITFKEDTDGGRNVNPFISIAWQGMRFDYPRYAYPGYKNKIDDDRPAAAMVTALVNSIKNISELWENFNKRAYRKNFASKVDLNKSFTRIVKQDGKKLGGGLRVQKITMSDNWNTMDTEGVSAAYGQAYTYTMKEGDRIISSGVAAYEPYIGGDENPMRLPVQYTQDVKWGLNNYFYLEEPFGESLFPSPEIIYREVAVHNLNASGEIDEKHKTGWSTYEFYSAKEFPVIVQQTPMETYKRNPSAWSSFFGGKSVYELAMSQGYAIVLNDMQGKPKAERTFNQTGQEISSTEYYYNTSEEGGIQRLRNVVDVVDNTGAITKDQVIGRDIEVFADMRQSEMSNNGKNINIGIDIFQILAYTVYMPHFPIARNDDYRLFRSAAVLKTIQYYGVVSKVVKKINGSSVEAANLLYDKLTGEPVLTRSNNEFDDQIYNVNLPAYWVYKQMGPAYQNLGMIMKDFEISGGVLPDKYKSSLSEGDELVEVQSGRKMWVINSVGSTGGAKALHIIDETGRTFNNYRGTIKLLRSGYRNQLTPGAAAITCMKNPVVNNRLKVFTDEDLAALEVLNASAVEYHEAWGQPADCKLKSCPEGYQLLEGETCYTAPARNNFTNWLVKRGDISDTYSNRGMFFYESVTTTPVQYEPLTYFRGCIGGCGRLAKAGIWLDSVPTNTWWGIEKGFAVTETKDYFIGYAVDDKFRLYIDGAVINRSDSIRGGILEEWSILRVPLTAGRHIVRLDAMDQGASKAAALEIYGSSAQTLKAGDSVLIKEQRIFSTEDVMDDNNVLIFRSNENRQKVVTNLYCPGGTQPSMNALLPNCGLKPKGACPDGYTPSIDGLSCIPNTPPGESDPSSDLDIKRGSPNDNVDLYNKDEVKYIDSNGVVSITTRKGFFVECGTRGSTFAARKTTTDSTRFTARAAAAGSCSRLWAFGSWFNGAFTNQWIGVHTCLTVPQTKLYYIGIAVDNTARIFLDGARWIPPVKPVPDLYYTVYPIRLPAGQHTLSIEAINFESDCSFLVEIFNNTMAELKNGTATTIYTTGDLIGKTDYYTYVKDNKGNVIRQSYACPEGIYNACTRTECGSIPNSTTLNPYLTGYLGNWLPWKQMAWLAERSGQELVNSTAAAPVNPDIRHNGHYKIFRPYWSYNNGWNISSSTEWITATTSTLYSKTSQEQESKDALDRYSSARYGYKETLPVAVGVNMRQREIFYDGFEDYKFNQLCVDSLPCEPDAFNISRIVGTDYASYLEPNDAHSGNYSLKVAGRQLTLTTYIFSQQHAPGIYLSNNGGGEYFRSIYTWLGLRGFCPMPHRQYLFSAWVKDGQPASSQPGITLSVNGESVALYKKATVEGWKLVEGVMDISKNGAQYLSPVVVRIAGNAQLIDDIRIFPDNGQLKTYSYDDKTLRLMAEMDENNYATFYEYDDEGSLVRVKKETEKGIMTIKENRSAYHKKPVQ